MPKFLGKFRGKVVANDDPLGLGRVQVAVPSVLGDGSRAWALPCVPYAGPGVGLFLVPPVGANVWVEFEAGDTNFPIWVGCFWSDGEVPASAGGATTRVFQCDGLSLVIEDESGGGVTLTVGSPIASTEVTVTLDGDGVTVETGGGKIEVTSSQVAINGDALVVR